MSVCSKPDKQWFPQRAICYPTMERAAAERRYAALHEKAPWHNGDFSRWTSERTTQTPYHHDDGVTIYIAESDVDPDDKFLTAPDPFGSEG